MANVPIGRLLACVVLSVVLSAPVAEAQVTGTTLGTLTCTLADPPAGEQPPARAIRCAFRPTAGGVEQSYTGTFAQSGAGPPDAKVVLIWVVRGPQAALDKPGFLAQRYVGQPMPEQRRSTVQLVGQMNNDIVLQSSTPVSDAGGNAVTVLDLDLKLIPT